MSTVLDRSQSRSRWSRLVLWFSVGLILVLGGGVVILRVLMTAQEQDPAIQNLAALGALLLGYALLFIWLLVAPVSSTVRWVGLMIFVAVPVVFAVLYRVEDMRVTGDMRLILPSRFSRPHEELLQDQLAGSVNRAVPDSVDLSGKRPTNWAEYRGPHRDGVVVGPELVRDWKTTPPRTVWAKRLIGDGHSAFVVVDKVLFTMEQRQQNEAVTCYDAATGQQIWAFEYPAFFDDRAGDKGPRATPAVADGEIFAFGATGMLMCLDARTGKAKWGPIDMLADNANVQWGMSGSPLIFEDLVIVNVGVQKSGAPNGTLVAFERENGSVRWSSGTANAGYSSPQVSTVAGKTQILLFDGEGLSGYDPANKGQQLWRFDWKTNPPVNVGQPLVIDGNRIFISSGYGMGCTLLEVAEANGAWSVKPLWKNKQLSCKFTNPVYYEGHIYGLHNGDMLVCIDAKTGERKWSGKKYGNGQLLLCKDLLVIQSESGPVALIEANPSQALEHGRIDAFDERSWNVPAMADGKLYIRNNREMACYDLTRQ
jgi:outer membrane protein assembly factor BamB